jgi:hypothetical protein
MPAMLLGVLFDWPLAALGVAAGAASVPIIIHLLNRNRYRIVSWAAMRFLLSAQRKTTRRMRLEQLLLLAIRTTIVLLLVMAMACVMPWAESVWQRVFPHNVLQTSAANRRSHKILVLDGSFSMGVQLGGPTCFERAKNQAARILQESRAGDGYSVLLMTAPPRRIVSQPSDDAGKVADEIKALHLPHGNADLVATFHALDDILRQSPDKFQEKEVYFLTDLQRSTWTARQTADPAGSWQKIQAQARTIVIDVGQDGVGNLAVTGLALGAPLATTSAVTPIIATVHNFGAEAAQKVRADLRIGRARATESDPPFAWRTAGQELVDVGAGQSATITFAQRFTAPGEYAIQVRLEGDALDLDDSRYAVVSVKDSVPVMLVNGKPAVELFDRATEWLRDALNPYETGAVPGNVAARPKVLSESQFADVGLGDLAGFDCVFLCDVARLSPGEVRRLETHLRRGGGVVFCLGPDIDLEAYNRLLYSQGEGILPARLLSRQRSSGNRAFTLQADDDDFKQPPLDAFAADDDKISLFSVRFRQYIRAELPSKGGARKILSFMPSPPSGSDAPPSAGAKPGESTAALPLGDPALVWWTRYRGRVELLTSTVNMDWTSWPISPSFAPFMQELLHHAVAGRLREQSAVVGEILEEFFPAGAPGLDAKILTPDGRIEVTRTQDRDDAMVLRWADTDISGIYRATIGGNPRESLFAVNAPVATGPQQASESDLARTNKEELQAIFPGWELQVVSDPAQVVHAGGTPKGDGGGGAQHGVGEHVARTLLLIMLGLMLLEVVLAWRFGHHADGPGWVSGPVSLFRWPAILLAVVFGAAYLALTGVLIHAALTGDFLGFMPEAFRSDVEASLSIPPPTSGEGTRWRLEFLPFLRDAGTDPWLAVFLGLLAIIMIALVYRREGRTAGPRYKALLAGLRVCVIGLTLAVLLPEVQLIFERQSWPDIAILIDDSRSMGTVDQYRDPDPQQEVDRLAKVLKGAPATRLALAQALLTGAKPNWIESMLLDHQVKVHVYHCSARAGILACINEGDNPRELQQAIRAIQQLSPEGDSSQLGTAVRQVISDFRGSSLAAIIMLTDGVTTEGEELGHAARYAAQAGVPLFFVGIGSAQETEELRLHDLQVEDSVWVNDRLVFEARLTGKGYGNLAVPVILHEKDKKKVLASKLVKLDPTGKPAKFRLAYQPSEPGERVFVLEVSPEAKRIKATENTRLERTIFVRESRIIKVLYVEGYARYDYRYLKNLLERESTADPRNKTIDLRVLLLDADSEYPRLDRSALADFPTKIELNQYDVLILGDVDPTDRRLENHWQEVAEFVKQRGGGLVMLAGWRYSPHAFRTTPLADVLPIDVTGPEPAVEEDATGFRPELTPAGRLHPIFRFAPDEAENAAIWKQLPLLYWSSACYRAKPAAEVLAVHPRGSAGGTDGGAELDKSHPLVLQEFVGAGRVLFIGFDEIWRWRFRENELHFNQFWIQVVRHLARSSLGRTELRLDRQTPYRRGEPIKVMARFPDDAPLPAADADVLVRVIRKFETASGQAEEETQTVRLARVPGSRASYETILTRTPQGDYQFFLLANVGSAAKPRTDCRVLPPPGEMDRLQMNQAELERAAEISQGRFYNLAKAEHLLADLPPGTRLTLNSPQPPYLIWNHGILFALALGTLAAEWLLRKRRHLV